MQRHPLSRRQAGEVCECETRGVQRGEGLGVKRRSNRRSTAPRPSSWAFDVKGYVSRSGSAEKSSPLFWVLPLVQQASNLFFSTCEEARADVVPRGKTEASWVLRLGRSPLW